MANPLPTAVVESPLTGHEENTAQTQSQEAGTAQLAWLAETAQKSEPDQFKYVLLMRFALLNLVGFGLLGVSYMNGLVAMVLVSDQTHLSTTIFVIFFDRTWILCTKSVADES